MAAAAQSVDGMIREYLVFRGFTSTLKAFESDVKSDRDKGFKVEKIVEQINAYLLAYDINSLQSYWNYLDKRFFSRLSHEAYRKVKKVETSLLRLYIIHAIQNSKQDKLIEFFEKYSSQLQGVSLWKDWFALPFLKNVDQIPMFAVYFTRLWQESVVIAIYNCLDTIFSHMNLPTLLNFEREKDQTLRLENQTHSQQERIAVLQQELIKIRSIKKSGTRNVSTQASLNVATTPSDTPSAPKPSLFQSVTAPLGFKKGKMKWRSREAKLNNKATSPVELHGKTDTTQISKENNFDSNPAPKELDMINPRDDTQLPMITCASYNEQSVSSPPPSDTLQTSTNTRPNSYADTSTFYLELNSRSLNIPQSLAVVEREDISVVRNSSPDSLSKPFIILGQDEFNEHTSAIAVCKFSQSGSSLATLDVDGAMRVWQCHPEVVCCASITSKSPVLCLDWIPKHDTHILLGRACGKVQLYDAGAKRIILESHVISEYPRVSTIAMNPNGLSFVLAVTEQKQLKRATSFSVRTPRSELKATKLKSLTDPSDDCRSGTLFAWDLKTFKQQTELVLDPYPVCITCMSYNHNGSLLVTGGADGIIRLFDTRTYDCLIGWHAHSLSILDVEFNVDETVIYSIGRDYKLVLWDVHKVSVKTLEFQLQHIGIHTFISIDGATDFLHSSNDYTPCGHLISFDSEGQYMMICENDFISLTKTLANEPMQSVMKLHSFQSPVCCLDWTSSPNCSLCVSGLKSGAIQFTTLLKQ